MVKIVKNEGKTSYMKYNSMTMRGRGDDEQYMVYKVNYLPGKVRGMTNI